MRGRLVRSPDCQRAIESASTLGARLRRFGRERRFKRLRNYPVDGIAAQRLDRWTHVAEAAARDVENPDHVRRVFRHETEALLTLHEFRSRRFARAHFGSHASVQSCQRTGDHDRRDADGQNDAYDEKPPLPLLFDGGQGDDRLAAAALKERALVDTP